MGEDYGLVQEEASLKETRSTWHLIFARPGMSKVNALRNEEESDDEDDDEPPARCPRSRSINALMPDMSSMETMVAAIMRKQMRGSTIHHARFG